MNEPRDRETTTASLFDVLRRKDENLPHLLDTAVQILRDEHLFATFDEVLAEDYEAMQSEEGQ